MDGRKLQLLKREVAQFLQMPLAHFTRYVPPPVEAALYFTRLCNSRCTMCHYWMNRPDPAELKTEEIAGIFDQLKRMGIGVLSLSAEGEISIRRDLPQILRMASEKGFLFSINSNALALSDEVLDCLALPGFYQVTIGCDTLDPAHYKEIRGVADGVEKVQRAIERMRARGFSRVVLGAVVLDTNLDDLPALAEWATRQGLQGVRFTAFQPHGFGIKWDPESLTRYRDERFLRRLDEVVEELVRLKRTGISIHNSEPYLRMLSANYREEAYFPVPCRVPWRRIHIFSNGDISLCQVMESSAVIGNLREADLGKLWYSRRADEIRRLVKDKACGGCWLSCYAEGNLRWSLQHGPSSMMHSLHRFLGMKG